VTRADLTAGYQATQTAHAVADFTLAHPETAHVWAGLSNSLIVLAVVDEHALLTMERQAVSQGLEHVLFREPDLLDEATAIAFAPGHATVALLADLEPAGKSPAPDWAGSHQRRARALAERMEACEQTPGQNVLEHGASVREHYRALLDHLEGRVNLNDYDNWRLPAWVDTYREQLLAAQVHYPLVDRYLTIHDCGKPAVLEVDADGRRHFPGHSVSSMRTYRRTYKDRAIDTVADLIEHDLDVHLLKAVDVPAFVQNPNAATHLLVALAEVTANSQMFGGIESTGFKMKFKHLKSRGNALCGSLFDDQTSL
jgi:hypothetical protein